MYSSSNLEGGLTVTFKCQKSTHWHENNFMTVIVLCTQNRPIYTGTWWL